MRNINRVMIVGNLTHDAELRHTQDGLQVLEVGVAVNDSTRNRDTGEWEDYTNFIDCVMMGDRAEKLAPKLAKGMKVAIEGRLRQSRWEKDGQSRSKIRVRIDHLDFISGKSDSGKNDADKQVQDAGVYDDDIPF